MSVISQNVHRAYLLKAETNNMAADVTSNIVDFKEMVIGSIQAIWSGINLGGKGTLEIKVSNLPEVNTFASLPNSLSEVGLCLNRLWNLSIIGYRYAMVEYKHGTITQGTLEIISIAKKSG